LGAAVFELERKNVSQAFGAVEVDGGRALLQVHGGKQAHQSKIMVTVEVTYKDVTNALMLYLVSHQLHLCTFAAIYQIDLVTNRENLGGMMTFKGRGGRGATKYFQLEVQTAVSSD
jgi:hypothetical protein